MTEQPAESANDDQARLELRRMQEIELEREAWEDRHLWQPYGLVAASKYPIRIVAEDKK